MRATKLITAIVLTTATAAWGGSSANPWHGYSPEPALEEFAVQSDLVAVVSITGAARPVSGPGISEPRPMFYVNVQEQNAAVVEILREPKGIMAASIPATHASGGTGSVPATQPARTIRIFSAYAWTPGTMPFLPKTPQTNQPADTPIAKYHEQLPMTWTQESDKPLGSKWIVFLKQMPDKDIFGARKWVPYPDWMRAAQKAADIEKWPWGVAERGLQLAAMPWDLPEQYRAYQPVPVQAGVNFDAHAVLMLRNTGPVPITLSRHDLESGISASVPAPDGTPKLAETWRRFGGQSLRPGEGAITLAPGQIWVVEYRGLLLPVRAEGNWKVQFTYTAAEDEKAWHGMAKSAVVEYPGKPQ